MGCYSFLAVWWKSQRPQYSGTPLPCLRIENHVECWGGTLYSSVITLTTGFDVCRVRNARRSRRWSDRGWLCCVRTLTCVNAVRCWLIQTCYATWKWRWVKSRRHALNWTTSSRHTRESTSKSEPPRRRFVRSSNDAHCRSVVPNTTSFGPRVSVTPDINRPGLLTYFLICVTIRYLNWRSYYIALLFEVSRQTRLADMLQRCFFLGYLLAFYKLVLQYVGGAQVMPLSSDACRHFYYKYAVAFWQSVIFWHNIGMSFLATSKLSALTTKYFCNSEVMTSCKFTSTDNHD